MEGITLLLASTSSVTVPNGGIDMFPKKIGPRILFLPDQNQILKAAPNIKSSEAEAMQYAARHTSVPVPEVYDSYIKDGCGYILMSKADGEPLADMWENLDSVQRAFVVSQLQDYVGQLRSLDGEFYGALWHQPTEDVFFHHLTLHHQDIHYGPYNSREEYNDGLVAALQNSRPTSLLNESDTDLEKRIRAVTDEAMTLSHGDLHPLNFLVNCTGVVKAIVD